MSEPRPPLSSSWKERKEKNVPHYDDGHYILVVHGHEPGAKHQRERSRNDSTPGSAGQRTQDKVKTLEAKQSDSEATPPQPTTFQQDVAEQAADPNQSPIAPPALHESHGIQWRGFGEVNYKVLDQREPELSTFGFVPGSAGNFYTGEFALFLTSRINDKASVLFRNRV